MDTHNTHTPHNTHQALFINCCDRPPLPPRARLKLQGYNTIEHSHARTPVQISDVKSIEETTLMERNHSLS